MASTTATPKANREGLAALDEALQAGATQRLLEQGARDPVRQPQFSGCRPWTSTLPPAAAKPARASQLQGKLEARLDAQPRPATSPEGLDYIGHGEWRPRGV